MASPLTHYQQVATAMRSLVLLALLSLCGAAVANDWVVCYFSSWARYRPGDGFFDVNNIDPFLCTHAVFGFAGLSNHTWTIEVLDPWNENCPDDDPAGNYCAYDRFVALKDVNPNLKTVLAVGGWNEGSEDYSNMVADPAKRKTFIDSSLALIQKEGFDGLDIDWEYPTQRGGVEADKENFVVLLDELRAEFDKHGLIMTAALASGKPTIDPSYDVEGLIRNLDVFSIMTYDYHGAWENVTHHNAPLCGFPSDEDEFIYFNVVFSIDYWLSLGVPPEKMVMGVPLYGRCFTLDDIQDNGMLADASQPGGPGPYTRLPGTLGWNEICERLKNTRDCTSVLDPSMHEPYMYCKSDKIWCGYDDEDSVYLKARFAKNRNLAGVMVWTIDTDDFMPTCGSRQFGLINTMKDAYAEPADPSAPDCPRLTTPSTTPPTTTPTTTTTTTPEPTTTTTTSTTTTTTPEPTTTSTTSTTTTTTTPEPTTTSTTTTTTTEPTTTSTTSTTTTTTTPEPTTTTTTTPTPTTTTTSEPTTTGGATTTTGPTWPSKPDCSKDPDRFFYPHDDCNKYWWCVNGDAILMLCGPGTFFNPKNNICDYPENVDTSECRVWECEADGGVFAGVDCNEYYECEHGEPIQKFCAEGLYFDPATGQCDYPANVDTATCNAP